MVWLLVVLSIFTLVTLLSHIILAAVLNDWSGFYINVSHSGFPRTHVQMWACIAVVTGVAVVGFIFEDLAIVVALLFTAAALPYILFQWKVIAKKLRAFSRR
jgi:hypothetical protein